MKEELENRIKEVTADLETPYKGERIVKILTERLERLEELYNDLYGF